MSVQTQIDRISGAVSAALAALSEKGVEVPAGTKVDGLAALIAAIEAGGGGGGPGNFACGTIALAQDVVIGTDPGFIIETGYVSKSGSENKLNFVLLLLNGRANSAQYNTHAFLFQTSNCAMAYKASTSTTASYDTMYYDYKTDWKEYGSIDANTGRVVIKAKNTSQRLNSFYGKSHISWAIWEEE